MKHRINKMAAIFIATIFALSGIGVAYASWTDTITITGTVANGDVNLIIYSWTNMDPLGPGDPPDYYSGSPDLHIKDGFVGAPWPDPDGKNVGWTDVTPIDTDADGDYDDLQVVLNNVYPCYYNSISIYPRNTGSIPVRIQKVIVKWTDSNGYHEEEITKPTHFRFDLSGNGIDDFEISYGDSFGVQLHNDDPPGSEPEISFRMHVLQDEGEGVQGRTLFSFSIEIVGIQWNGYTP